MTPILHAGPGLVIGIPTLGRPVPLDWALAFKSLSPPTNYNVIYQIVKGQEVASARIDIAKFTVQQKAKYLFFLGDDVVCPPHTLRQLIYRLEQDSTIGIVGGVYCAKTIPSDPLVYRGNGHGSFWDWKIGEFFEVTGLGLDCNLIRVSLFEKLSKPWFKTVDEDEFLDGKNNAEAWTEDLFFYKKVKEETNFRIFCDASVICEHHDVYEGKVYTLPSDSLPMRQRAVTKSHKMLMIGQLVPISAADQENFEVITFGSEGFDFRGQLGNLPFEAEEFDWVTVSTIKDLDLSSVKEWLRVTKTKLTLVFAPFMHLEILSQYLTNHFNLDFKVNGQFVEFVRTPFSESVSFQDDVKVELVGA